jgi:hypothetical protein
VNNESIYLGAFASEREAGLQYDRAARYYFAEFAKVNFPEVNDHSKFNPSNPSGKKSSSPFRGVYYNKSREKWCASVQHKNRSYFLGDFTKEEEAALAYNLAAQRFFGETAKLNRIN